MYRMLLTYKDEGGTAGSLVFRRVVLEERMHRARHDRADFFSCPTCLHGEATLADTLRQAQDEGRALSAGNGDPLLVAQLERRILELQNHRFMDWHQQHAFREMCDSLTAHQLLVVMDFGQWQVMDKGAASGNRFADLVFTFFWLDADGKTRHEYYDCMADELDEKRNKKTFNFVQTAFLVLAADGRFDGFEEMFVWSDCGPQHFRTSNTLYFFRMLQQLLRIHVTVYFFYPRHGHNPCDRHLGSASRHVRLQIKELGNGHEVMNREYLLKRLAECKFTVVKSLPPICEWTKVVGTLSGINQYLMFTFPEEEWSVDCHRFVGGPAEHLHFGPSTQNKRTK